MVNFFHNYLPQPVLFDFGVIKIYYYGAIFVVAFLAGYFLLSLLARRLKVDQYHLFNLLFYVFIFGLIGARLYHVFFYNFAYFSSHWLEIFKVWEGGIAIQGAIITAFLTIVIYCRRYKINFLTYSDLLAVPFSLAQAIGRWGNYFNQEVYGKPTDQPWGIPIEPINRVTSFEKFQYFHPTFFYESVLDLLLFFILLILILKNKTTKGTVTLTYLLGYAVIRFFMEFLRLDETVVWRGMRWPQIFSLAIIMVVIINWVGFRKKSK